VHEHDDTALLLGERAPQILRRRNLAPFVPHRHDLAMERGRHVDPALAERARGHDPDPVARRAEI
jgi:hypothetical protein